MVIVLSRSYNNSNNRYNNSNSNNKKWNNKKPHSNWHQNNSNSYHHKKSDGANIRVAQNQGNSRDPVPNSSELEELQNM